MSAAAELMIAELRGRGLAVEVVREPNVIAFPYKVALGARAGEELRIGLVVPGDYPASPPGGPCVCPAIGHPKGNVHGAGEFGPGWAYWSRPFPNWPATDRDAAAYLAHLHALFSEL